MVRATGGCAHAHHPVLSESHCFSDFLAKLLGSSEGWNRCLGFFFSFLLFFQSCSCSCCPSGETIALSEINSFVEWFSYRISQTGGKTRKMILHLMICVAELQVKNCFSVPNTAHLSRDRKVVASNTWLTRKPADQEFNFLLRGLVTNKPLVSLKDEMLVDTGTVSYLEHRIPIPNCRENQDQNLLSNNFTTSTFGRKICFFGR